MPLAARSIPLRLMRAARMMRASAPPRTRRPPSSASPPPSTAQHFAGIFARRFLIICGRCQRHILDRYGKFSHYAFAPCRKMAYEVRLRANMRFSLPALLRAKDDKREAYGILLSGPFSIYVRFTFRYRHSIAFSRWHYASLSCLALFAPRRCHRYIVFENFSLHLSRH